MNKRILNILCIFLMINHLVEAQSAATSKDYGEIFASITANQKVPISTSLDTFLSRRFPVKKVDSGFDFRQEYYRAVQEKGMLGISYIFDMDGNKPLYEVIFEFEDADTLEALLTVELGLASHPTLANHWLLSKSADGAVSMLWYFNNKIVIAANLPDTEFAHEPSFDVPDNLFDDEPGKDGVAPAPKADETQTLALNTYLKSAAEQDLKDLRATPIEGKKDEFVAAIAFDGAEQTVIRKNAAGQWRLEARRNFNALTEARTYYDATLKSISTLEGLEYRLVRKAEYSTNTGNTYVWTVQNFDDQDLGVLLKIQLYALGGNRYGVKIETGKE
jgi:hypothetical protein